MGEELERCVLELLQCAGFDFDRCRLGREPALFTGERILAKTLLLGGHLLQADFEETGQGEFTGTFFVHRTQNRRFQRCEHRLGRLGFHARLLDQVGDQGGLVESCLDGLECYYGFDCRCGFGCSDLLGGVRRLRGLLGRGGSFLCGGHGGFREIVGLKFSGWCIQTGESILGATRADVLICRTDSVFIHSNLSRNLHPAIAWAVTVLITNGCESRVTQHVDGHAFMQH